MTEDNEHQDFLVDDDWDNNGEDHQQSSGAAFIGNYWSTWSVTPHDKLPFKAPAPIQAILTAPTKNNQHSASSSVIIVCQNAELTGLSPSGELISLEWCCRVSAPRGLPQLFDDFKLHHAVYDYVTDKIYFSVLDTYSNQPFIFQTNRHQIANTTTGGAVVPLDRFVSTSSRVFGLAVDAKRRLLFACEEDVVTIWQLVCSISTNAADARLTAQLTLCPAPRHIATHFASSCVKIAISQQRLGKWQHQAADDQLIVLHGNLGHFDERIGNNANRISNNTIDDVFVNDQRRVVDVITENQNEPFALGSVRRPWGIVFDPRGNLFVADCLNNRVQIFQRESMEAVWATSIRLAFNRAFQVGLIANHPRTGKPACLVSKFGILEWYY